LGQVFLTEKPLRHSLSIVANDEVHDRLRS